jgi:predicted nucleic acid-binding protein
MTIISLDSGPLSLVTQRRGTGEGDACKKWLADHLARGTRVVVPEIVEYELRRELLRASKTASVKRLDAFVGAEADRLILLTRSAILRAAQLWAEARQKGLPTADPKELDIDVVQSAQLLTAGFDPKDVTIATSNVGHLSRFLRAEPWQRI